jgi:two-component system response regulator RegX3
MLAPQLSRKEFDVLHALSAKAGEAVSRDDVAVAGWPERDLGDVGDAEITQLIKRVRERIESDPRRPRLLTTVRGFGYKLEIGQSQD